jgi:hypothetical protein
MESSWETSSGMLPKLTATPIRGKALISALSGNHPQLSKTAGKHLPPSSHGRGRLFNPSRAHY